jgi:hypothetical protein
MHAHSRTHTHMYTQRERHLLIVPATAAHAAELVLLLIVQGRVCWHCRPLPPRRYANNLPTVCARVCVRGRQNVNISAGTGVGVNTQALGSGCKIGRTRCKPPITFARAHTHVHTLARIGIVIDRTLHGPVRSHNTLLSATCVYCCCPNVFCTKCTKLLFDEIGREV